MSARRTTRRLVRLYPRAWRDRYGSELEALIFETSGGRAVSWRTRADVARSAAREHAHRLTADGGAAPERSRTGIMLALWGSALFVCGGATVQKVSEHWQTTVPSSRQGLPSAAFDTLLAGAAAGGIAVLAGLAVLLPSIRRLLRTDQGPELRPPLVRSAAATLMALAAGLAIVVWAHHLTASQRDGHDDAYAAAFIGFAVLAALCLAHWVATAGALLRRLELSPRVMHAEAVLACALAAAMVAMTFATALWWSSATSAAPAFPGSPLLLGGAIAAMLIATLTAGIGAGVALLASRSLPPGRGNAETA